jgi:mRNA-degrading endonuclease RelE of RelBE toxin-antitoxin system
MYKHFITAETFAKKWDSFNFPDSELRELEKELSRSPDSGPVISGTGGFRKLRFAPGGQGKSGSYRIIYRYFPAHEVIALVVIYKKNEATDLSEEGKKMLKLIGDEIKKFLN